ncbi:MAG TPA: phage terminase large subunit [Clostridia bacterium]|nr:phage terminase large subunit [Clostridia bacterium]
MIQLSKLISPAFYPIHHDIAAGAHTYYWLNGGRGSTKSSFVGIEIPLGIMRDAAQGLMTHALVMRRYEVNCRTSVYEQIKWGIEALGVADQWDVGVSPMQITYRPTGQRIYFRGADDVTKVKSIKVSKGWIKYLWYEEANEFEGPEKIRTLNQSVLRGGTNYVVFYTYNPPRSAGSWVNREAKTPQPGKLVHKSDYRTVPRAWLGEQFFIDAEHLKAVNEKAYRHEYLGEITGTGGEVFENLKLRPITDDEIKTFDRLRNGIDWGYASDPFHYTRSHYDKTRRRLYIFGEIHQVKLSNLRAAELLKPIAGSEIITCDSAEPKSIDEMRDYGLRVRGAKKGPDSVEYGIKWLQDLEAIIIDPTRCPNATREFSEYELERDKEGNFKAGFPDKNNHSIDAERYACEDDMKRPGVSILK